MSSRKFGITDNKDSIGGILINSVSVTNNTGVAEARDQLGRVTDIAVYSGEKEITLNGIYQTDLVSPGTVITVNNDYYIVTSTQRVEQNRAFQVATIKGLNYPQYVPPPPPPVGRTPLSFKAVNGAGSVSLNGGYTITLQYKINNGQWTNYSIGQPINLNQNDIVYMSGANDHFNTGPDSSNHYFQMTGSIEASGNIQSLVNFKETVSPYEYYSLFVGCTSLITAPELPATGVAYYCYQYMFYGCSGLLSGPSILPAMTLAPQCYQNMFNNCSSLITAPELPATGLAYECYSNMFAGCRSLTDAPHLPKVTNGANLSYYMMFYDCSSLSSINVDWINWTTYHANNWVAGVAPTGIFYKPSALPEIYDKSHIPSGWRVINKEDMIPLSFKAVGGPASVRLNKENFPELLHPIVLQYKKGNGYWIDLNIGDNIYLDQDETVYISGANDQFSLDSQYYNQYFYFSMIGTIEASGNIQSLLNYSDKAPSSCFVHLFKNCSGLISVPNLPATNLEHACYYGMFSGCINLSSVPSNLLPATTLSQLCYQNMFRDCVSLTTAPELPATTLSTACYQNMFRNCIKLTDAPYLPATQLSIGCYTRMFRDCISLSSISVNFSDWKDDWVTTIDWVLGVRDRIGTFTKPSALPDIRGPSNIPSGWTVVNKDD